MLTSLAGLRRFLVALAALACIVPAHALSNSSATAPAPKEATRPEAFRMAPEAMPLRSKLSLGAVEAAAVEALKKANSAPMNKRLQIGIGREVPKDPAAQSAALRWTAVPGGTVAQWEVTSPGARALRIGLAVRSMRAGVEIRFGSRSGGPVYGPFSASEVMGVPTYWSPVLEGEAATVEIFVRDGVALPVMAITQLSHLLASPTDPNAATELKNGASESCQVDLVCRSPSDAALAEVGKSVAKMIFVEGASSYLCTGTLLNPIGTLIPYFYSANHCISTQAVASTLTTHWFYDRVACGLFGTGPSYVQLAGGATLLYADGSSDALLLRLNQDPPAGAVYAGWEANTLTTGTALTGVHHPRGDWKKVSLGNMGGFQPLTVASPSPSASFVRVDWTSGVTEGGSSGSGIFVPAGAQPFDYRLRGGLWGGASTCSSPTNDYYSRLDQVYPFIRQYLNPTAGALLSVTRSGTGSGVVTSSPSGINCGGSCSATFDTGTQVTLTATPSVGSIFSGWSGGGCSGTSPSCTVTMSASLTVTAGFGPTPGGQGLVPALDNNALSWSSSGPALWSAQSQFFHTGGSAARSGAISGGQVSTISTTVTGPGTLSFWWKVSSEAGYDFLTFYIDGVAQAGRISGEVDWANQVFDIPAGTRTLEWRYSKDGTINAGLDAGFLDNVSYSRLTTYPLNVSKTGTGIGLVTSSPAGIDCGSTCSATFNAATQVTLAATPSFGSTFSGWSGGGCSGTLPTCTVAMTASQFVTAGFALSGGGQGLGLALDNSTLNWVSSGNAPWSAQSQVFLTGGSAARSGSITNSQVSTLATSVTGPGTLSFSWKVSSEGGFDFLTFYIDGVAQPGSISGERDWVRQSVNIPAGTRTVEWRYSKDASVNAGLDAAWLDAVSFSRNLRDFNADGKTDLLWQNTFTGDRYIWLMNGSVFSGSVSLGVVSTVWSIAATGDFNADGQVDLLWQNTVTGDRFIWFMNNGAYSSGVSLGVVPTVWSIAGTGDFNGDAQTDILWQNTSTGDRYIWFMSGASLIGGVSLGVVPTVWSIAGTGDLNGDGKPDILWQNAVTGDRVVWFMNGATYIGGASLGAVSTAWSMAGTGDFNGDGKPDIIWQNTFTGERTVWFMNGAAFSGAANLGTVPPEWRLVP